MSKQIHNETIFALASARGMAGVAVLRISGSFAHKTVQNMIKNKSLPERYAKLKTLICPITDTVLDQALVLFFAQPNSFTGEDVVELHCHGSPAVIEAVCASLSKQGLRLAEPGEFSRRAFGNGRMDLVQAEGLADLIDAKTEKQRQQALAQMAGEVSQQVAQWRKLLLAAIARVEAEIDFPDEEDVAGTLAEQVLPGLRQLQELLQTQLLEAKRGQTIRNGFLIALIGPVNAGKSTLLNALAGRERAIVSDIPGTTRDVIEVDLRIAGFMVSVADTAGLRETRDKIEQEGIRRSKSTAIKADMRLFLQDVQTGETQKPDLYQPGDLLVQSKADLQKTPKIKGDELSISAKTGTGINQLLARIEQRVIAQLAATELPALSRLRHIKAVQQAIENLQLAEQELEKMPELAAEHLRAASQNLAVLLGEMNTEQVLGEIFSGFCIGK
ncbi:tRNA-5-carboxymethylaminomethyl-2-thiouridine(34)synthesis protein MnmE [hydrothermal vent metagenome]|uniref:tRNA-5-carboxymethylaminomethyl-2-thiouridine(34) synthesis protein MnmE n=1 Tax=hydrothermal vent metagenome TaxID=652676 RepID=A0A3B0RA15_9ZZZZ